MSTGTVKFFNETKGFGFIKDDESGKEYFVHVTGLSDKIRENDTFNFIDLEDFMPGKPLTLEIVHADSTKENISLNHTYNQSQIEWFKAGSALNLIKLMEN